MRSNVDKQFLLGLRFFGLCAPLLRVDYTLPLHLFVEFALCNVHRAANKATFLYVSCR